jgi:hypothetical protein
MDDVRRPGTQLAQPHGMNARRLLMLLLVTSFWLACATARGPGIWSDETRPVLLYHGTAFELRIREGRVEQLLIPASAGTPARLRTIDDIDELRRIYATTDQPIRVLDGQRTIEVMGWAGLQCMRPGEACGPAPADLPGVMFILRFE